MLALQDQGHQVVGTTLAPTAMLTPDFLSSQTEISIPEFSLSLLDWISSCLWPDSHGFPFGFGSKSRAGSSHQHREPEYLILA